MLVLFRWQYRSLHFTKMTAGWITDQWGPGEETRIAVGVGGGLSRSSGWRGGSLDKDGHGWKVTEM